jgi:2-amino-4-hydroxy-6-hydroxymethyldihydropteridine diphosphokinase
MLPERKKQMKKTHFIAIGANLPGVSGESPLQICNAAIAAIIALPGVGAPCRSPWYSTAPVPASAQPRYINGMLRFTADMTPQSLLLSLQSIERRFGRVRGLPDAARTLDLDIIDSAGAVRTAPDPILPHPRAHTRLFVLLPLRDLAPTWRPPGTGDVIGAMITSLPPQDVRPV